MSEQKPDTILDCSLKYTLHDADGQLTAQGEAKARLNAQDLALLPSLGHALVIGLREITSLTAAGYRLALKLSSGETVEVFHLGQRYDDFCRELTRLRHELTIKDLLMQERLITAGLKARYTRTSGGGEATQGACEIRLYETAVLLLPQAGDLERIPYSYIDAVREQGYTLTIEVEDGGSLALSHLGPGFDLLRKALSETMNDIAMATQRYLQELLPEVQPAVTRQAARLLRDGRAARRADLEALGPDLWPKLEERLAALGMAEKYGFLRSLAQPDEICIGMKRGLMGDLTGDYMWVLVPIYDADAGQPGNAVAMEAASGTGVGRATYFFRLTGREDYRRQGGDLAGLHSQAAAFVRQLSRCMMAINFRREPIYLSEEKLREPRYERYRAALLRIPELRLLRERFIGRVIQNSPDQWRRDVMDLLRFNVATDDDSLKWRAAGSSGSDDEEQDDLA
jgi:hypothetical protein